MGTNSPQRFEEWFTNFSTLAPMKWQAELAKDEIPRSQLIRIPTGYGKTLGALGAWLYNRVARQDDRWPRRLIWTLPMRTLVEQTAYEVQSCLARLDLLWNPEEDHRGKVGVHLLMGGVDQGGDWNLYPEECAVFVATQDMALSRALNRGYGARRARWPMEFGLLNHDALWVLDEVQLMDVGLATSAQLQSFFDDDAKASRSIRPRISWWMSATLQPDWLKSVDTEAHQSTWITNPTMLASSDLKVGLATIRKDLESIEIAATEHLQFAKAIKNAHEQKPQNGEFGRITLVVCNTVERAVCTYEALESIGVTRDLRLVHSRYRPFERATWKSEFLSRDTCTQGVDRIIVATQVIEAGVDISATVLFAELSPWSSLVQRFGRCARYGGSGKVVVVDRGSDERVAPPYAREELDASRWALSILETNAKGADIASIEDFEQKLSNTERNRLFPYQPKQLLQRRELDELFDTTPDLSGADIDVSPFIRSGDERDLSVFWLDIEPSAKGKAPIQPSNIRKPSREELCSVKFIAAREWLCGKETKENPAKHLLPSRRAWVWDWIDGEWKVAVRTSLIPGAIVCVSVDTGGYRADRGFDPKSKVPVISLRAPPQTPQEIADDFEDTEELSAAAYKSIGTHNTEVGKIAKEISKILVSRRVAELLELAGYLHDIGKAHPSFQAIIEKKGPYHKRIDLAKAPEGAWQSPCLYRTLDGEKRLGFRHELASCLALFSILRYHEPTHPALIGQWIESLAFMGFNEVPLPESSKPTYLEKELLSCSASEFDLLAYLVLSHHGKVRVALHAGPKDQKYLAQDSRGLPIRGVREGDKLYPITLDGINSLSMLTLTLAPATLGLSQITGRSWRERTSDLLRIHGPASLAYLEAILIAADRRASKLLTVDPLLTAETLEGA